MAQLNSFEVQRYIEKNCFDSIDEWSNIDENYIKHCFQYKIDEDESISIIDKEDLYRIDYITRKQPFPVSVYYTMTEGMAEDFFGAWCSENENGESYNPDIDWRIIFPVP